MKATLMAKRMQVEKKQCLRCNYEWWPRISSDDKVDDPKSCPKCRSPYWDKPIERKSVSENRKKKQ